MLKFLKKEKNNKKNKRTYQPWHLLGTSDQLGSKHSQTKQFQIYGWMLESMCYPSLILVPWSFFSHQFTQYIICNTFPGLSLHCIRHWDQETREVVIKMKKDIILDLEEFVIWWKKTEKGPETLQQSPELTNISTRGSQKE